MTLSVYMPWQSMSVSPIVFVVSIERPTVAVWSMQTASNIPPHRWGLGRSSQCGPCVIGSTIREVYGCTRTASLLNSPREHRRDRTIQSNALRYQVVRLGGCALDYQYVLRMRLLSAECPMGMRRNLQGASVRWCAEMLPSMLRYPTTCILAPV